MSVENAVQAYAQNKLQGFVQDQLTDYAKEQLRDIAVEEVKDLGHKALFGDATTGPAPEQVAQLTDDQHPEAGPGDSRDALLGTSFQVEPDERMHDDLEALQADAGAGKIVDLRKEEAARKELVKAETEAIDEVVSRKATANVLKEASEAEQTDEVRKAREATAKAVGDAKAKQIEEEAAEQALKDSKLETADKTHEIAHKVFNGENVSDAQAQQFESTERSDKIDQAEKKVAAANSEPSEEVAHEAADHVLKQLKELGIDGDIDQIENDITGGRHGQLSNIDQVETAAKEVLGDDITKAAVDAEGATQDFYKQVSELPADQLQVLAEGADDRNRKGNDISDEEKRKVAEALAETKNANLELAA